jgi:acyl-CoA thioesterase FadM
MDTSAPGKTREFHRIRYPDSYRPKIRIQGEDSDGETLELSERGVRFRYQEPAQLSAGMKIEINITFHDGKSFQLGGELLRVRKEDVIRRINGELVRIRRSDVIMRFSGSIPIYRLMNEQQYIKYIAVPQTGKTRQFHRIRYPLSYRPKIRIQGEHCDYDAVELSERGIRFIYKGPAQLRAGLEIEVRITFYDGESIQLKGELLRSEKEDVIMRFSGSLTTNRLMQEQLHIKNYIVGHI